MVPDNGLQLEEDLQTLLVPLQLLVAQPQVVQGLHAGGIVVESNLHFFHCKGKRTSINDVMQIFLTLLTSYHPSTHFFVQILYTVVTKSLIRSPYDMMSLDDPKTTLWIEF